MSHYDCPDCGEYGCIEVDCMSEENIAKREQQLLNRRLDDASRLLVTEVNRLMSISGAISLLKEHGRYNPEIHNIKLSET